MTGLVDLFVGELWGMLGGMVIRGCVLILLSLGCVLRRLLGVIELVAALWCRNS